MSVEIICPLYNAEQYIRKLHESLLMQKGVNIKKISYLLTESIDKTSEILKEMNLEYDLIKKEDFSHSLTREKAAMKSKADILVFITQDIEIKDVNWLKELIKPIENEEVEASFSRQLTKFNNIEKYTREMNYPAEEYIVNQESVNEMGLRAFFFSDASSAIKTSVFKKLNGYDGKRLPTNEDQYIAYKLITSRYRIKYCANSIVYHSHDLSLKELYKRYYDTGKFYKQENYIDKYGTNKTGGKLAKFILKRIVEEKNWNVLFRFLPDMFVRFIGMKVGKFNG